MELKLTEIIERARLSRWTSQYVLKHPDLLPGMPEAGSQGMHRKFDREQALRFSLCTTLVQSGMQLKEAADVVDHCLRMEIRLDPEGVPNPMHFYALGRRVGLWKLLVLDGRFLQISRGEMKALPRSWYDVETKKMSEQPESPIRTLEINLTRLARRLASAR